MRLPRWTVYPALALIAAMLVLAFPHPQVDRHQGAAMRAQESPRAVSAGLEEPERAERPGAAAAPEPSSPAPVAD